MIQVGAHHEIDVGGSFHHFFTFLLGHATDHSNQEIRVLPFSGFHFSQTAVHLLGGLLPYAASVEDEQVGLLRIGRRYHAALSQQTGNLLRVVHVHLAAESFDEESLCRHVVEPSL